MDLEPKAEKRSIVFVHLGAQPPRRCLFDAIDHALTFDEHSRIFIITERQFLPRMLTDFSSLLEGSRVSFVFSDELVRSPLHDTFLEKKHHQHWRHDFWRLTTERFFFIHDLIQKLSLENVLHIESDVLIFGDILETLAFQPDKKDVLFPLDRSRGIASVAYFSNSIASECLCEHIISSSALNDMELLEEFFSTPQRVKVGSLPTLPKGLVERWGLDPIRFSTQVGTGNSVFDAAALGQFLGGIDPIHSSNKSFGFVNEEAPVDPSCLGLSWGIDRGKRFFAITDKTESSKILNLHVHSKASYRFHYRNHNVPSSMNEVITGDRIMSLCDVVLTTRNELRVHKLDRSAFNGKVVVLDDHLYPDGNGIKGSLFSDLDRTESTIFLYGAVFKFFIDHIARNLDKSHILVIHNSQIEVDKFYEEVFVNPAILKVYAQNTTSLDSRFFPVPTGVMNTFFDEKRYSALIQDVQLVKTPGHAHATQVFSAADFHSSNAFALDNLDLIRRHAFIDFREMKTVDHPLIWLTIYCGSIPIFKNSQILSRAISKDLAIIVDDNEFLDDSILFRALDTRRRQECFLSYYRESIGSFFELLKDEF